MHFPAMRVCPLIFCPVVSVLYVTIHPNTQTRHRKKMFFNSYLNRSESKPFSFHVFGQTHVPPVSVRVFASFLGLNKKTNFLLGK